MIEDPGRVLPSGLPKLADYRALTSSAWFKSIERYSNDFLRNHAEALTEYRRKWVRDPLHQWSRQWEYPYTIGQIFEQCGDGSGRGDGKKILDAGSGVTFLPYFVAERIPRASVTCSDYDVSWTEVYRKVNARVTKPVEFVANDLRELQFPDHAFDIVYCVSVLEHTDAYAQIVREFRRVLKPDGTLIVTFDISIDGDADIPPEKAGQLLDVLFDAFPCSVQLTYSDLPARVHDDGIVTTRAIGDIEAQLLPWMLARPSRFRRLFGLRSKSVPRNLTFFCHTFRG